jgi:hypothetical protein
MKTGQEQRAKGEGSNQTQSEPGAWRWRRIDLIAIFGLYAALCPSPFALRAQDPALRFGGAVPQEVETVYERGLAWLASKQSEQGNWQSGQSGSGVDGICLMAFLAGGEEPNFGRYAPNIAGLCGR